MKKEEVFFNSSGESGNIYYIIGLAKNIVASGLAEKCEVALSYAIGVPTPTSIDIDTFYTGHVSDTLIKAAVEKSSI